MDRVVTNALKRRKDTTFSSRARIRALRNLDDGSSFGSTFHETRVGEEVYLTQWFRVDNVVDRKRFQVLVDAPDMTRKSHSIKRLALTDFVVDVPRACKKTMLVKALADAGALRLTHGIEPDEFNACTERYLSEN